jgi:hypothetical protein
MEFAVVRAAAERAAFVTGSAPWHVQCFSSWQAKPSPKEESAMSSWKSLSAAVLGAVAFTVPMAGVFANHVKVEGPPATTVVVTPPVPVPATQTLQANEIKAGTVRANTIYANKIEADEVRGAVVQTKGVKVKDSEGKIQAPEVTASVIYADEIKANTVMAETIYVRKLERR